MGRPADGARLLDNRIHDCGRLPATNHDHGIYVVSAAKFRIAGNVIYDNADRGVQLYPDAQRGVIARNVLDGNGSGVIFGGDESSASGGNRVELNVIANSRLRWNVEQSWAGEAGRGNVVRGNCVHAPDRRAVYGQAGGIAPPGGGFLAFGNRVAAPLYVDRRAKDFRLRRQSPCAGRGPAQPVRRAA